jgi:hypothetical protein
MRTTLDIDEDVLFAAKDIARRDQKTLGQIISAWGRMALQPGLRQSPELGAKDATPTNDPVAQAFSAMGFQPFEGKPGVVVTIDILRAVNGKDSC